MKKVLAIVLAVLVQGPVVAPASALVYKDPKPTYELQGAKRFVVQGKRVGPPGSCRFPPTEMTLRSGVDAVEERRVEIDTVTCRQVVERGVPPRREVEKDWGTVRPEKGDAFGEGVSEEGVPPPPEVGKEWGTVRPEKTRDVLLRGPIMPQSVTALVVGRA